ncbi:ribbon-helix-helix protein, CopG family (plasmid) [Burkholderia sp. FERM BP-3421]|uniref:CopG family ribbon-helix-helix protein n=1 Tax=Burkholderia sp. FERM BP-3421 TaxID=1494466 RepID=UPI0023603630|nr:ribbon-helix-helix protein, CopG family [Burkholderia sp. FERM BP-3421]WDD90304.1 ribbon-helix-helix protein, CopG family [Burkholderia sp. FERM BP-3421]
MATSIKLDTGMQDRVRHLAEQRRRTPHWIMREAIAQYVEREEKRESIRQEAVEAWHDYQTTGLHVPHADMDRYMAELEAGRDAELPGCRK